MGTVLGVDIESKGKASLPDSTHEPEVEGKKKAFNNLKSARTRGKCYPFTTSHF